MDLVDRPNTSPNVIICGSPSSIWTPSCVVAPGISCLVPILNFNAFGLAFAFPCTPRRSDRIRQRLPASRIFSFPPSWKSKTAKQTAPLIHPPACCFRLPSSQESLSRLACGTSKPVCRTANQPRLMWPAPGLAGQGLT